MVASHECGHMYSWYKKSSTSALQVAGNVQHTGASEVFALYDLWKEAHQQHNLQGDQDRLSIHVTVYRNRQKCKMFQPQRFLSVTMHCNSIVTAL